MLNFLTPFWRTKGHNIMTIKPIVKLLIVSGLSTAVIAAHHTPNHQDKKVKKSGDCISSYHSSVIAGNSYLRKIPSSQSKLYRAVDSEMGYYYEKFEESSDTKMRINHINMLIASPIGQGLNFALNTRYGGQYLGPINWLAGFTTGQGTTPNPQSFHVDEVYLTYFNQSTSPLYAKIGKSFQDFGNYESPYTYNQSLSQIATQFQGSGVSVGASSSQGVYGNVYTWQSKPAMPTDKVNKPFKNFGFKIGFHGQMNQVSLNTNFSMINDVAQALSISALSISTAENNSVKKKVGAYQLFGQVAYQGIGAQVSYTAAAKNLVEHTSTDDPVVVSDVENTKPKIASIGLSYQFKGLDRDHKVSIAYDQNSDKGQAILPKSSLLLNYLMNVNKHYCVHASYGRYKQSSAHADLFNAGVSVKL